MYVALPRKVAVIERYATVLSKKAEESQGGSEGQAVDAEATELEVSSNPWSILSIAHTRRFLP